MAQLGDTIVQGDLRVTGEVHGKTICYVTTSSSWNDLDAAYKVGKTLILRVENGTNFFDEYRLSSVNQSTGSNRFIFCGFPTVTSVTSGTVNSLKVNGYICYLDGSTTKWIASGFNNADLTTKAYVDGRTPSVIGAVPTSRTVNSKALSADITLSASDVGAVPTSRTVNSKALSSNITLSASDVGAVPTSRTVNSKALSSNITLSASDVGAVTQMSTAQLGSSTSFSSAKTNYLTLPNSTIAFQYNTNGAEETLLYSSGTTTASWGNILRWGNNSNYMYIGHITNGQGVSPSTDWEKISAGYADNANQAYRAYPYYTWIGLCNASSIRYWCVHKRGSLGDGTYAQGVFPVLIRTSGNAFKSYNVTFVIYRSGSSWSGKITKQIVGDSDGTVSVTFYLYRDSSSGSTAFGIYAEISCTAAKYLAGYTSKTCVEWMDTPTGDNTGDTASTATGAQVSTISSS